MIRHGEGILFDTAYLEPEVRLWVRLGSGELVAVSAPHAPLFYLGGPRRAVQAAAGRLAGSDVAAPVGWTQRTDFWSGAPVPVLAVRAFKPQQVTPLARRLLHQDHRLRAYDVDIDACLSFHSRHRLFPLARVALSWEEGAGERKLRFIRALDDPWDPEYKVPELKRMDWRLARSPLVPLGGGNWVRVAVGEDVHEVRPEAGAAAIRQVNELVARHDPDLIVSEYGDEAIFPWLVEASQRAGMALALDRLAPPVRRRVRRDGKTFTTYGGVMYKAPDYPLLGRWHLDLANSFFGDKSGSEGVLEMARVSRIPVQRQARTSGGTAITAMEIHLALERAILVPFIKDQVEGFRTAADLLAADKGGLTYYPPVGLWEQVIELDFHQMYPSIMAVHNVSPETMNCRCCVGKHPVPGTGHHTCTLRRGLVPDALAGLLAKRLKYKALLKACPPHDRPRFEARATALKWTLVTTFGYQGFHNAKFGLIEAHEAITAWGRESLLAAKEICEGAGYRLLHALTDSLYVAKRGWSGEEIARLCQAVQERTGLTLGVEGVYDWLCFLPAKTHKGLSVATRYLGRFSTGELKLRGIKTRQHSPPLVVRRAQQRFLAIMARCRSAAELARARAVLGAARDQIVAQLHAGGVPAEALALAAQAGQEVERYRSNAPVAVCLRILAERGIRIAPGQVVRYVIVDKNHRDPARRYVPEPLFDTVQRYDAAAYEALVRDAWSEVAGLC